MRIKHYAHILIMISITVAMFSAYSGWYAHVEKESANAVSLAQQIQDQTNETSRAEQAKGQLQKAQSDESSIHSYFVNTNDVVPFLGSLQATGAKLGTKVDVASVSAKDDGLHPVLELAVTISGPFDAVERTLGAIEYEAYDTQVVNLTLDTTDISTTSSKVPVWTAATTIRVGTAKTAATTTPTTSTTS